MRDTISARSVKEALGQVRTWRAKAQGTSGQGHRSPWPLATAPGCRRLLRLPSSGWGWGVDDRQCPEQTPTQTTMLSHHKHHKGRRLEGQRRGDRVQGHCHDCPRPAGSAAARAVEEVL